MARNRRTAGMDAGWGKRNRAGSDADLDITPMIDVTFLLLIFFMVTSTMKPSGDLDMPSAVHGTGVDTTTSTFITIKAPEVQGGAPQILLGQGGDSQEATLEEVRPYVEAGLPDKTYLIIKAEREVPHGFVNKVGQQVADLEGLQFFLAVQEKRSSR